MAKSQTRRGHGEGSYTTDERGYFVWRLRSGGSILVRRAKTQKELRVKVREAMQDLDKRGGTIPARADKSMTTEAWLKLWLKTFVEPHRAYKTHRQYEQLVRLYMIPAVGKIRLSALNGTDVQAMLNGMTARGVDENGNQIPPLSPATVQLVRVVLSRACKVAITQKLITGDPTNGTERPRVPTRSDRAMTPAQTAVLIGALVNSRSRYAPILQAILSTGLRITEALGLQWSNLHADAASPSVDVRHRLEWRGNTLWTIEAPKTAAAARALPMNRAALDAFSRQRVIWLRDMDRLGEAAPVHDLIFTTETGEPMHERNVQRVLDVTLAAAGLPHFSLHDLRRTYGTTLANAGVQIHVLKRLMGHENPQTTLKHYIHAFGSDLASAVNLAPNTPALPKPKRKKAA